MSGSAWWALYAAIGCTLFLGGLIFGTNDLKSHRKRFDYLSIAIIVFIGALGVVYWARFYEEVDGDIPDVLYDITRLVSGTGAYVGTIGLVLEKIRRSCVRRMLRQRGDIEQ